MNEITTNMVEFNIINRHYLLIVNIPIYKDDAGRLFLERGWHHDLVQHQRYLPLLTLAAPVAPLPRGLSDLVPVDAGDLKLVPLPSQTSLPSAVARLLPTSWLLWRAIGQADIVHSGIAGWPFPLGWLANPIAALRKRKRIIIVESAPWRLAPGAPASWRPRLRARVCELLARYFCRNADLCFYTQPGYLKTFHDRGKGPAYLAPATWVNDEDIIDDERASSLWEAKLGRSPRFLFAGRLLSEKGVRILLQAAAQLARTDWGGTIDVIGNGPLREEVVYAAKANPILRYFPPVEYGEKFFSFLEQYDGVLVPSLSDEQPRILFDAAARAVPVIASDTDGIRPHVVDGDTGRLVEPGDSGALAAALAALTVNQEVLCKYGMESLCRVRRMTHRAMHAERSRIIALHLDGGV